MHIFKLMIIVLATLLAMPAMAETPVQPAAAKTQTEQSSMSFLTDFGKSERDRPATATDKIVDRFMALNVNPEASVGVSYDEYFTMVEQRAKDRFSAMDANHDDEVTEEEYREFWKAQKAQYYRLKR